MSDLNPHALEVGDRLTLTGSGFPEGRAAKVSFQGDVFRAGQSPLRDVTIVATAAASDPHSIAVTLNAELAREFCGAGDAVHATFRGATTAAFQARESGAPPVRGTLEGVVLDVNPASISKSALALHEAEAQRFAEYAGMAVVHSEERDVLLIDTIDPEGRAARAGLLPGDALLELDGVRLASLSDLIPPPRARLSHVSVRRGDEQRPSTFALDVSGFQPGSPSELAPAATLLGFAVALLLLFASPLGACAVVARRAPGLANPRPRAALGLVARAWRSEVIGLRAGCAERAAELTTAVLRVHHGQRLAHAAGHEPHDLGA